MSSHFYTTTRRKLNRRDRIIKAWQDIPIRTNFSKGYCVFLHSQKGWRYKSDGGSFRESSKAYLDMSSPIHFFSGKRNSKFRRTNVRVEKGERKFQRYFTLVLPRDSSWAVKIYLISFLSQNIENFIDCDIIRTIQIHFTNLCHLDRCSFLLFF